MDCFCRLSRAAATVDLLDCLAIHLVVLAAWDDQADVEDPEGSDMFSSGGVGGLGSVSLPRGVNSASSSWA